MKIKDIVTFVSKSITPQKGVTYNLYSLPSFDEGKTFEVLDGADIQSNKYDVPNKCILFNKLNVRFKRVWRIDSHDENKIASTEFLPLVVDEDVVDFQYCYYLLISDKITNYLCGQNTNTSGSHKRIDPDNFLNIEIKLPKMSIQRQVGKTLSALDRKIVLNKQINDNLEAMAKQLYDYWFVQFDFPNEEGKPYKSSGGAMVWNEKLKREIPEGWYAENICKIANILSGGTPSKAVDEYWNNGTIPFFGPTDCNGSVFQIKTADHITQKGLEHCASSLFEEGIVIITARGSIGKLVIVGTPMAMNQSCYALQSKEGEYEYLYFLTTQLIDCLKAKGSGSVFKSIIASDIEHSTLCVATENVVSDFCKKVKPLFEKLKANTIEIAKLTKQRDELLPLLMNGQATVNYHLSASTSISFDISFLFLNFTNGNSLYEIIGLDYQCFALPLHSKENTHGTIQEDKRHIQ